MIELLDDGFEPAGGFGGDALNAAVYLAREAHELSVALVSAIGDDPSSDALLALCREEGIDVSHLRRVPGARLGSYRVSVDDVGERSFEYERSLSPFRGALDDGKLLPDAGVVDVLVFNGIAMAVLHEPGRRALLAFAETVHTLGGLVAYDINHRPALWVGPHEAASWLERIAPIADVVLASADDGRALLGVNSASEVAAELRALGTHEAVVTDGPGPTAVAILDQVEEVLVAVPRRVIDTTAAGDAFDAGYLVSRSRGADPPAAIEAGHRLAAGVVAHRGAIVPRSRAC